MLMMLYVGLAMVRGEHGILAHLADGNRVVNGRDDPDRDGQRHVFQLVPQRFPREIGVLTALVGAAGEIGGFILPNLLGGLKGATGSFSGAFDVFALAGLTCVVILAAVSPLWEREFVGRGGLAVESA